MKPPRFDYLAPSTIGEALSALTEGDGDARPLGGGQSLLPVLNFRLGEAGMLVDLGRIAELVGVSTDDTAITVRAMTPTARLLSSAVAQASPVVAAAARLVGHPQIRSRGTVGGSIAHADPAAELPAVAMLTDASIEVTGPRGRRDVAAGEFFEGLFATSCEWDEIVTAVRFPRAPAGSGWGFREFARRPGDFALAGVGVTLTLDGSAVETLNVVAFGVGPTPIRVAVAEEVLRGQAPTAAAVSEARSALTAAIDPGDTLHGSGAYRRRIAGVLFERALGDALRTAGASGRPTT